MGRRLDCGLEVAYRMFSFSLHWLTGMNVRDEGMTRLIRREGLDTQAEFPQKYVRTRSLAIKKKNDKLNWKMGLSRRYLTASFFFVFLFFNVRD